MTRLQMKHQVGGLTGLIFFILLVGFAWGGEFDVRNRVTKGTLEYGLLGGYWKGNDVFQNAPSTNRKAIYIFCRSWGSS